MRSCRVSEGTVWRSIFSRSRKSSSSCDACAAMSAGSLGGRSLTSPRLYSATTKSMAWSLGMLRWTEREMGGSSTNYSSPHWRGGRGGDRGQGGEGVAGAVLLRVMLNLILN
ncbi:hypothetical protein INR49_030094 [Caranx melampygus]|nr:hypothetical protein INR49_030094 [Caranx melampygus]